LDSIKVLRLKSKTAIYSIKIQVFEFKLLVDQELVFLQH